MTFTGAIKTCFRKYVTFSGRAPRSEFWKFILFIILTSVFLTLVNSVIFGPEVILKYQLDASGQPTGNYVRHHQYNAGILGDILFLIVLLPWLAASWRRMHDSGRAGYLPFLSLFAGILLIVALLLFATGPTLFWHQLTTTGQVSVASFGYASVAVCSIIGTFILNIYWLTRPSDPDTNQYGPNPNEVPQ